MQAFPTVTFPLHTWPSASTFLLYSVLSGSHVTNTSSCEVKAGCCLPYHSDLYFAGGVKAFISCSIYCQPNSSIICATYRMEIMGAL